MKCKRHDWFHPALITLILEALRKRSGNYRHAVNDLKLFGLYQIEMLRKQLTAGIYPSTDVKLDVSLSTLKPLSMAWLLRAFAGLKDCKPGILSAFVKSGTAKAWDVDFQRRAAGDVNRLFSMLPGPADAVSDEVAPVLTEEQRRSASEQQFAGAITDEEAATVAQITEDAASPVDPAARIVRGVTVVEPDTAFEATPSESLADAVSAKAAELASAGQIDEDALAAATQGKPRGRKRKPTAEQPVAGASDAAPAHAAPQGKKKRGRPPGSKNKKTLEKERAAAAAAAGAVAAGPPAGAEGA